MAVSFRWLKPFLAALLLFSLTGCEDDPVPSPPDSGTPDSGIPDAGPPDSGPPDSGPYVWDGTYTELPDPGDWVDPGAPYAPCTFDTTNADSGVCEQLSRFNVSQCDRDALAALPQEGLYQAAVRNEIPLPDGGVRISSVSFGVTLRGGTPDTSTMNDEPLRYRDTQGGDFALIGQQTRSSQTYAVVGCKVPAPHVITGCIATCRRGVLARVGTFEAHRVAKQNEPESSGGLTLMGERYTPVGTPVDLFVTKGHAYVVSTPRKDKDGGLSVFDVTNPRNPLLRTTISLPGDNYWNGVWAKGNALYIASQDRGTLIYDISEPAAPLFIRSLPTGDPGAHTVLVDGDRLYSMDTASATYVHELTDPLNPVLRAVIGTPPEHPNGSPHDTFVYQGRLYISHQLDGYVVADVTDLDNVRFLGVYDTGPTVYSHHSAVGTFAGKTIAFVGSEFHASHVRVLDVTNPARIVKMGEFRMRQTTSVHNMLLRGNRLYVAWYQDGLRVLDVSNPTKPKQVAHHLTFREEDPDRGDSIFEGAIGLRIPGDGHVYVVDTSRGLLIFNEL
ncbi:LVIVD repeat-containing protein [Myxococcus landrumensis]|uniref:Lipoprotein n=1 Tax=Myxococcus landrumensis TaxID=2813577 RepID=A0ABX7N607_9BACT|nr:hypothetical protein [Myxococcus landrumus]QSQ13105.1 hypothetical protein JY572_32900 [Myxococcus landrumus]